GRRGARRGRRSSKRWTFWARKRVCAGYALRGRNWPRSQSRAGFGGYNRGVSVVAEAALEALIERASGHYPPRGFVLSGPSAGGKDSALLRLRQEQVPLHIVVTFTTRPPRRSETDGIEYRFVSRERFEALLAQGEFLEHTEYAGNL